MENRNEIAVELSALSALVGGISRANPYGVPEGYFDQLASKTLARIAARSGTFQVPEGYFDGFAASVLSRIKSTPGESVQDELSLLSPIVSRITRVTPYSLPEGYFEELSPVLALLKDKPAFQVPEGYFVELSPVLTVAHDRSAYKAPEGYFDRLPDLILERVTESVTGARIVRMEPQIALEPQIFMEPVMLDHEAAEETTSGGSAKVLKGHWWKYASAATAAVAACFVLIFSLPGTDTNHESVVIAERGLSKLSDQDLQAYLDGQHSILAESEDQHAMPGEPVENSTAALYMNEGEVKSLLSGISDDDLQQYMEEHGKAEDFATN